MYNLQCNTLRSYPREDALLQAYNMHCLDVASRSTCQPHPRSSTLSLWHCAASLHCSRCSTFPMHCTFIDTLSKCTTQLGSTIKLCNSTALVLQWFCFLLSFDIGLSEFAFLLHLNTFLLLLTWTFFISVGYLVHFCPQQMSVKETSTKLQFTRVDNLMINGAVQCAV